MSPQQILIGLKLCTLTLTRLKTLTFLLFFQEFHPLDEPTQFSPSQPGIRYEGGLIFFIQFSFTNLSSTSQPIIRNLVAPLRKLKTYFKQSIT